MALNDGLEEETPASPKHRKRSTGRPRSKPSSRRLWAQRQIGSPKAKLTLSGIPTISTVPAPSTSTEGHSTAPLTGVLPANKTYEENSCTLAGVQLNETLPDLVVNRTSADITGGEQDLEAASVLLSLGDSLESTVDDIDDNAGLMPIGGGDTVPEDVAPQPLRLDQISVDAAIADIVQSEEPLAELRTEQAEEPPTPALAEPEVNNETAHENNTSKDVDPEDDVPLATLSKTKSPTKGVLKTKTYGLKKKPASNRTFKCPACETWKSTVQHLNAHYKRRHLPQMCGICGRTFDLPSSLSQHMYDHNERRYHCNKCEQSFHFESELTTHKVSHRSKSKASFQCMKSKCGKWFMRKWDLTLHLQKHRGKKHECDYKDCTFSTETEKQLKEHYKSHNDDCSVKCKLCGKGFKYRSGLKRHRDNDHKDQW